MKRNFVKDIAPAKNIRYLVQLCGASERTILNMTKFYRQSRNDVDDEQLTGHQNTCTADENTARTNAIFGRKVLHLADQHRPTEGRFGRCCPQH
jgi:hypothetical protein